LTNLFQQERLKKELFDIKCQRDLYMDYFNQPRHDIPPFKSFADAVEKCEPLIYINLDKYLYYDLYLFL
jgi:hypothetical protein